jgi:hypothetical protein
MTSYLRAFNSEIELEIFKEIYQELTNAGVICIPTSSDYSTLAYPPEDEPLFVKITDQIYSKYWPERIRSF